MSKTAELKKLLTTLNNIYTAACASDGVYLDEVEVINKWTSSQYTAVKKLDEQKIVLHYTLIGPKNERP